MAEVAEELKAVAQRWMDDIWQRRNLDVFNELHAPDFIDHSPSGRAPDRESYRQSVAELFTAFPDWEAVVNDLVVDEAAGKVAVRWTATGTHRGMFLGAEPSGRRVTFCGIEIVHIEDGLIVERWGEWDGIALLAQLGVLP